MLRKSLLVATALLAVVLWSGGGAAAATPRTLADGQLDRVTAGGMFTPPGLFTPSGMFASPGAFYSFLETLLHGHAASGYATTMTTAGTNNATMTRTNNAAVLSTNNATMTSSATSYDRTEGMGASSASSHSFTMR